MPRKRSAVSGQTSVGTGLHITVAVSPTGQVDLSPDLRLLKAALLYADRVKFCSLTSSMLLAILAATHLDHRQRTELMEQVHPYVKTEGADEAKLRAFLGQYKQMLASKNLRPEALAVRERFKSMMSRHWADLTHDIENMAREAGAEGLASAPRPGLVEIHTFRGMESTERLAWEFFGVIAATVSDISTFPLFDDRTGHLYGAALKEGKVEASAAARRWAYAGPISRLTTRATECCTCGSSSSGRKGSRPWCR